MILARQVFKVKFGHMDKVLAVLKAAAESGQATSGISRVLTDITGDNFTLVFETKIESMDDYWNGLRQSFADAEMNEQFDVLNQYMESGHREFYTIEYEFEG